MEDKELDIKEFDILFSNKANQGMRRYDHESFKRTHKTLFACIIKAMYSAYLMGYNQGRKNKNNG